MAGLVQKQHKVRKQSETDSTRMLWGPKVHRLCLQANTMQKFHICQKTPRLANLLLVHCGLHRWKQVHTKCVWRSQKSLEMLWRVFCCQQHSPAWLVWQWVSVVGRHFFGVLRSPPCPGHVSPAAMRYQDHLRRYAGAVGHGFLLMHSGTPHMSGMCQQFLKDEDIDAMDWLTCSIDQHMLHYWLPRTWRMLLLKFEGHPSKDHTMFISL